ncbi:MAG: hypothetical protein V5A87_03770 [Candidatus Bipolaricaulota bacterium]|nr:hypothetical protein [Candidatus Bipolaricaulota bacterium]
MNSQVYAVLTGDVVNSGALEGYGKSLDEVLELFEKDYRGKLPLKVDRYSGDRFQLLLDVPWTSLRAALYLFTRLASREPSVRTRISIGIGGIVDVPEERVSTGAGEAFRLSGSKLDQMKKHQRVTLAASNDVFNEDLNSLWRGSMDLLSAVLMDLSSAQAEVIWYKLKGLTQEDIARKTGRRQQTVSDILIAGYWRNMEGFLQVYEKELSPQ